MEISQINKFLDKVNQTDSCWEWTGARHISGYGHFGTEGKTYRAHRFAWQIWNGEISKGLYVLHKCDNPSCVNPDHLFLGTAADNNRDRHLKGRDAAYKRSGELNWRSKFTNEQVRAIRRIHFSGRSQGSIARQYKVTNQCIERRVNKKVYRDV